MVDAGYDVFCGTSLGNTLLDNYHPKEDGTARNTGTIYLERFIMQGNTLRWYSDDPTYNANTGHYEDERAVFLEYCIPENVYCNEERYYKLDKN